MDPAAASTAQDFFVPNFPSESFKFSKCSIGVKGLKRKDWSNYFEQSGTKEAGCITMIAKTMKFKLFILS